LVEVPYALVTAVKIAGIGDAEVPHEFGQVSERRFHQEMEMIVHENIGVELDRVDVQGFGENPQKCLPVVIFLEDVPPLVTSTGYMVNSPGILNA
jgi:hypothetical protein